MPKSLYLFKPNTNKDNVLGPYSRLKRFSMRDSNGTLMREFIAMKKGSIGALFDNVTQQLFFSQGEGMLVPGPRVK